MYDYELIILYVNEHKLIIRQIQKKAEKGNGRGKPANCEQVKKTTVRNIVILASRASRHTLALNRVHEKLSL